MQADYWDALAASFEEDVFQPVATDLDGTILNAVLNLASKGRSVADIGCGTGSFLPTLAGHFGSVMAIDLSKHCLEIAQKRHKNIEDVKFLQHDLTLPLSDIQQFDVGVCLNVAIMSNYDARMRLLRNVMSLIRPRGHLLMLVPAVESVLLTIHRLVLWNIEDSKTYLRAAAAAASELGFTACSIRDGIVEKGGTPTKHYLREELELLINELGHKVCSIEKVQYPWHSEFDVPPASMGAPYPWDWLVVSTPVSV
ncbi:MAG: 2-polyprenyl-3-methyl-5-hydroxy-6-metoxy-1,4-benzoquinol methylase [Planctomycetota bacterium]|jgi:2-polyprenyl-3-methyl-5-hydroxy-6-metoxy-1,4-benzoquinol methylase